MSNSFTSPPTFTDPQTATTNTPVVGLPYNPVLYDISTVGKYFSRNDLATPTPSLATACVTLVSISVPLPAMSVRAELNKLTPKPFELSVGLVIGC